MAVLDGSIQLLVLSTDDWATATVLLAGQPGYDNEKFEFRIGDGVNDWADLPVANQEAVVLHLFANFVSQPLGIASLNGSGVVPLAELPVTTDPTFGTATNANIPSALSVLTLVNDRVAGVDWKDAVLVRTTANITLSGLQTIDGVSVPADARVGVMNQSTASQNGIYLAKSGAWVRATDADTGDELSWSVITVASGTVHADTRWLCNTYPIVLGTTAVSWVIFGGATYTADESSLTLVGSQFSAKANGIGTSHLAADALKALSALASPTADNLAYYTGSSAAAYTALSAYIRTLLDDANDVAARATLGLGTAAILNEVAVASTADTTVSSSTWVDVTGCSVSVDANTTYEIEASCLAECSSVSGGMGMAITGPVATRFGAHFAGVQSAGNYTNFTLVAYDTVGTTLPANVAIAATAYRLSYRATLRVGGSGGTVKMRIARGGSAGTMKITSGEGLLRVKKS